MHIQHRGPVGHIQVQACYGCKGFWAERGKLDELDENVWINSEAFDFDLYESEEHVLCPVCQAPLDLLGVPHEVDATVLRCPSCFGFWLQESELEAVQLAAHRAMRGTLDEVEVVGPSDKNHPNIVELAKANYSMGRVDDIADWLTRRLTRRR